MQATSSQTMTPPPDPRRARFLRSAIGAGVAVALPFDLRAQASAPMKTRPIPSTREPLPVIGCGTWIGFDVPEKSPATDELGRVVDALFLLDWKSHLPTLRQWKAEGRIRYVGVTHYTSSAYGELEAVLRAEAIDFVQVNHAIDDRDAARRILPLAAERGVAVLINRPFGGGGLLKRLGGRPLPPWAAEIGATAWSQVLLKFVLSHPAVTCAIPGTGNARHMAENAAAGAGEIPPPGFWERYADDVVG